MPCVSNYLTKEEEERHEIFLYNLENDPEFRLKVEQYQSEHLAKIEEWRKEDLQRDSERKQYRLEKEVSENSLEYLFFKSPMTVFLCKAMDIVVSNFDYKFVTADMEWWYKEHKYRDANNEESSLSKEELANKLIELNEKYKVIKYN